MKSTPHRCVPLSNTFQVRITNGSCASIAIAFIEIANCWILFAQKCGNPLGRNKLRRITNARSAEAKDSILREL